MQLKIISAGAGSGKTHRLTNEMVKLLEEQTVRASGIIATTFTTKAAAELFERVRISLIEKGLTEEANQLSNALIGTVHSLGVRLLRRFSYEAGVSPALEIMANEDQQLLFNQSLSVVLTSERVETIERLADRLGMNKSEHFKTDWRALLRNMSEIARSNDFTREILQVSKLKSVETLLEFLQPQTDEEVQQSRIADKYADRKTFNEQLGHYLTTSIQALSDSEDISKKTTAALNLLREALHELDNRGELFWYHWVKMTKLDISVKSKERINALQEFAASHLYHNAFRKDIEDFISAIFDLLADAIEEFDVYKKQRGLIDYTDMEVAVRHLLRQEEVCQILASEIDLLLVDEFQDTNPIQLDIFLRLSKLAKHSIWVGDPKQSIYGFRGAEPALMQAIIQEQGGLKPENILDKSWRSRKDIVHFANTVFSKAFSKLPPEQVALEPIRQDPHKSQVDSEGNLTEAVQHWQFRIQDARTNQDWFDKCIAAVLRERLKDGIWIQPKGSQEVRLAKPGDVAIFCRTNLDCVRIAGALHHAGLGVAISRAGLMDTAEGRLVTACLRYVLNRHDSLAVAEILVLAAGLQTEEVIESRLNFLKMGMETGEGFNSKWEQLNPVLQQLNDLRSQIIDFSGSEILALLSEELELRKVISCWGSAEQRLSNLDELQRLALSYEDACSRLHTAASLAGFLLWLSGLRVREMDFQGSGEQENAVNILTYHKGKGLEYPVVICHGLESKLKADIWGLSIIQTKECIDFDNILGGRWLRLWVNPYADQVKNTKLSDRIEGSVQKERKISEGLEEEARLLYVGLTRARDYLILPVRDASPGWLNRVSGNGNEQNALLSNDSTDTLLSWQDELIRIRCDSYTFPFEIPKNSPTEERVSYLYRLGQKAVFPLIGSKGREVATRHTTLLAEEEVIYGPNGASGLPLDFCLLLRKLILADDINLNPEDRNQIVERIINSSQSHPDLFVSEDLLAFSGSFHKWLTDRFRGGIIYRNYPLWSSNAGQNAEFLVDFWIQIPGKTVMIFSLVDFSRKKTEHKEKAAIHEFAMEAAKSMEISSIEVWFNLISEKKLQRICS